ncbi:MAG: zinc ribbon domain-containing protein [Chloroflexi bacterium]|nr:zinc ribbon domain-containing protein [Chloroflexota bacterium]
MPLYEYRCNQCRKRVTLLVRGDVSETTCPECGSRQLTRLLSTFSIQRGYMDDYESILNDSRLVKGLEQDDPRALAEWNHRMSHGLDQDVGPEYQEMLERMEKGEVPAAPASENAPPGPSAQEG